MMKNLTPEHFRCAAGAGCPGVYLNEETGLVAIVGKIPTIAVMDEVGPSVAFDENVTTLTKEQFLAFAKTLED